MIEKMKFLSITGPKEDFDRVIDVYLSKYDIQLESALAELRNVKNLHPFVEANPYKDEYEKALELTKQIPHANEHISSENNMSSDTAAQLINTTYQSIHELLDAKDKLAAKEDDYKERLSKVEQYIGLNYDISEILHFKFIKFRFGRFTHEYYDKFMSYVYDGIDSLFYKCQEYDDYIWGVYFVPDSQNDKIDAIYQSMHFERFFLPDEYTGTPNEASAALRVKIDKCEKSSADIDVKINAIIEEHKEDLLTAIDKLKTYTSNFDIRKLAACTKDSDERVFYIICGWMSERDSIALRKEMDADASAFCIIEEDHGNVVSKPPTLLKNLALFKPFEMYVEMYGLPAYKELDPTVIIALTYSILFGFMFGDAGQGLVLLIGGALLWHLKKSRLAAIISRCGFFSTIFGFMFGSFFGFEDIIKPLWLRPSEAMMSLPMVGNLNTVFIVAIVLGMCIILMTMIFNMINRFRMHETGEALCDTNGLAGMIFYAAAVITIILFMSGHTLPGGIVLLIMFILPLIVIFCKEPLTAIIEKHGNVKPDSMGMFFVQGFFELFEVLLSYFSNTLSFVRVGAFAVSHAAMMQVVLMLAGAENGTPNWAVIVFGNLFVMGMEGLIVGIQVLRLEYYELFSRFYSGTGRAFKPYGKVTTN